MKKKITQELIESLQNDQAVRINACRKRHLLFFLTYLSDNIEYSFAPMHYEMFALSQGHKNLVVMGFRNCAKSTILTYSYPIWAIVGEQQKRFILIASQTRGQAAAHFQNIKRELESNALLRKDLGPFETTEDLWGSYMITIAKYKAKVMITSVEQSTRGIRYLNRRPDLIILDDVEDSRSVKTKEGRDKIFDWLTRELTPMGDRYTRVVVVGNLLHEDSLLMRLKDGIENKSYGGEFRAYPILNGDSESLWPSKFPDKESVEAERLRAGSPRAWKQEYLLKLVTPDDQIIQREWIQYYTSMPSVQSGDYQGTILAIDPAISLSETADYTAMVGIHVFGTGKERKMYVHKHIVNSRLTTNSSTTRVKQVLQTIEASHNTKIIVEGNGYQSALAESLHHEGIMTEVIHNRVKKEERIVAASGPIEAGRVFFPSEGSMELVDQLVNFGTEKYDDLADAFAMAIQGAIDLKPVIVPEIYVISY